MQTQTVIRAQDYLPEKPELAEGTNDELVSETDGLTVRLFGARIIPKKNSKIYGSWFLMRTKKK